MSTNQRLHWAWVILGVCFVNLFINYSIRLGYGVVLPEMIRDLKLGRAAGGTIYNAYLLTYILVTPFTGFLTDRLGARRVITVCCLFLCLGIGLMGTADSLLTASIYYAIAGL
ncbi:MFS transporter, partial [bacterium]|nr:MFS transporter [bacterium]